MFGQDTLSILVSAIGVNQTVADLRTVKQSMTDVVETASLMGAAGAALTVASGAAAVASLKEFEKFEKLTRTLEMYDPSGGLGIARQLEDFTLEANTASEALYGFAMQWANMTGKTDSIMPMVKLLDAVAVATGAGASEISRMGLAFSQIRAIGTVRAEEINQLIDAGLPMAKLAAALGKQNTLELRGMDSDEFFAALLSLTDEMKGASLATQDVANTIETFGNALAPTGGHISALVKWLNAGANAVATLFRTVNHATNGYFGLIVILGMFAGGVILLYRGAKMLIGGFLELVAAARAASVALSGVATSGSAAGAGNAVSGAAGAAGVASRFGWIGKIVGVLGTVLKLVASIGSVLLKFVVLPLLALLGFIYALEELVRAVGGWRDTSVGISSWVRGLFGNDDEAKKFKDGLWRMPWQKDADSAFGGNSGAKAPSGQQPVRRSSVENLWDKSMGTQFAR